MPAVDGAVGDRIEFLEAEVERLRAAVQHYGLHQWDCPMNDVPDATECTCGFSAFEQQGKADAG